MIKVLKAASLGALVVVAISAFSQTINSETVQTNAGQQQGGNKVVHTVQQRDGNEVFAQNCSRCHVAPQGFSPRIAGTVARHMRVRAGLSKEDELSILRFLNP